MAPKGKKIKLWEDFFSYFYKLLWNLKFQCRYKDPPNKPLFATTVLGMYRDLSSVMECLVYLVKITF